MPFTLRGNGKARQEANMLDHQEVRLWADHHKAFGAWARTAANEIGEAFRVLAKVQYDQPWLRIRR
jgi:hypothetical protein